MQKILALSIVISLCLAQTTNATMTLNFSPEVKPFVQAHGLLSAGFQNTAPEPGSDTNGARFKTNPLFDTPGFGKPRDASEQGASILALNAMLPERGSASKPNWVPEGYTNEPYTKAEREAALARGPRKITHISQGWALGAGILGVVGTSFGIMMLRPKEMSHNYGEITFRGVKHAVKRPFPIRVPASWGYRLMADFGGVAVGAALFLGVAALIKSVNTSRSWGGNPPDKYINNEPVWKTS